MIGEIITASNEKLLRRKLCCGRYDIHIYFKIYIAINVYTGLRKLYVSLPRY